MKVKKFKALNMRDALISVKNELGDDAVILSNKKVDDGIEIIASLEKEKNEVDDQSISFFGEKKNSMSISLLNKNKDQSVSSGKSNVKKNEFKESERDINLILNKELNKIKLDIEQTRSEVKLYKTNVEKQITENDKKSNQLLTKLLKNSYDSKKSIDQKQMSYLENENSFLKNMLASQMGEVAWKLYNYQKPKHAYLLRILSSMGIASNQINKLLHGIENSHSLKESMLIVLKNIIKNINVSSEDVILSKGFFSLIGPPGTGKTTTVGKLATRALLSGIEMKNILLLSMDMYRVGSRAHLSALGKYMGIETNFIGRSDNLENQLTNLNQKLVVIDTAGLPKESKLWKHQHKRLITDKYDVKHLLVLSCNYQIDVLRKIIQEYIDFPISGCVLTNLDQAQSLGGVLCVLLESNIPIMYVSNGSRIPDDLHLPNLVSILKHMLEELKQKKQNDIEVVNTFQEFLAEINEEADDLQVSLTD